MVQLSPLQSLYDPREYLNKYYLDKSTERVNVALMEFIRDLCYYGPDVLYGKILDYGCGPTIHMLLPFCDIATELHVADNCSEALDEITLWLSKDEQAFNWRPYFSSASKVCKRRIKEGWIRKRLRQTVLSDLRTFNVNDFDFSYEAVIAIFVLENICTDLEQYRAYVQTLLRLLIPGGRFGFVSAFGNVRELNGEFVPTLQIDEQAFEDIFSMYPDKQITTIPVSENSNIICVKGIT